MEYVELFKKLDAEKLDTDLVKFISAEIIELTKGFSVDYHIGDILKIILDKYWEDSWSVFAKEIVKDDFYGWYNLKELLKKLLKKYNRFNDENIKAWMVSNPNFAPQKVVQFIQLMERESEGEDINWTPLLIYMFDNFYSNPSFLDNLNSELHSYFWSGSLLPLLESRKKLVEKLLNHSQNEIREFAKNNVGYFNESIKSAKKDEENGSLRF